MKKFIFNSLKDMSKDAERIKKQNREVMQRQWNGVKAQINRRNSMMKMKNMTGGRFG